METYEDMLVAHERVKHLNRICGRREYVLTGSTSGHWIVRRMLTWDPAFLAWRRNFYRWVSGK